MEDKRTTPRTRYINFHKLFQLCEERGKTIDDCYVSLQPRQPTSSVQLSKTTLERHQGANGKPPEKADVSRRRYICGLLGVQEGDFCTDVQPVAYNAGVRSEFDSPAVFRSHVDLYAQRVQELVHQCTIPPVYQGEPTDIVWYTWQMKDTELDSYMLALPQQCMALMMLVKGKTPCLQEVSKPPQLLHGRGRIGKLNVIIPSCDLLRKEFATRKKIGEVAFERLVLTKESTKTEQAWLMKVRHNFTQRFEEYLRLAKEIERTIDPYSDLHNQIIQADYQCRKTVHEPGSTSSKAFKQTYSLSRIFINMWRVRQPEHFKKHWRECVSGNSANLVAVRDAIKTKKVDAAKLSKSLDKCLQATLSRCQEVEDLEFDRTTNNPAKDQNHTHHILH